MVMLLVVEVWVGLGGVHWRVECTGDDLLVGWDVVCWPVCGSRLVTRFGENYSPDSAALFIGYGLAAPALPVPWGMPMNVFSHEYTKTIC